LVIAGDAFQMVGTPTGGNYIYPMQKMPQMRRFNLRICHLKKPGISRILLVCQPG
jgi:hypothetical protein